MINCDGFKDWLIKNTSYTTAAINDVVSRMNRADKLLEWDGKETYIYYLEKSDKFLDLSVSVKSQMRKAVKYYIEFNKSASEE